MVKVQKETSLLELQKTKPIEKQSKNDERYQQLQRTVIENLNCCICLQTIVYPYSTTCNHLFCLKCLEEVFTSALKCPLCRQPQPKIESFSPDPIISQIIMDHVQSSFSEEAKERFVERIGEHLAEQHKLFYPHFKVFVGLYVDFHHKKQWRQGEITAIKRVNNETILVIRSLSNRKLNEQISIVSRRLARFQLKSRTSIDNLDTMLKENNLRIDFKQRIATVRESGRSEEEKKSKIRELREAYNKKKAELTIKFGRDL